MENIGNKIENQEKFGRNVKIVIKFIRHGERGKDGELLDIGRKITREKARESGLRKNDFNAVKAIGSDAGPKSESGMQRSLETADLYASEIAGDEKFKTKINRILSYETLKTKPPYNHIEIYNKYLPDNFNELQGEEKIKAAKIAQEAVVNHVFNLKSEEAERYKKEAAGSFAYVVDHYAKMTKRLYSGSKVLLPAGTHGGTMEFLLQQALDITDKDGKEKTGFDDIKEIGGEFNPSEAYSIFIETDEKGNLKDFKVTFDSPERPALQEMHLDSEKIKELSEYYKNLHKDE